MLRHVLRIFRSDLPNWVPTIVVVGLVTTLTGACLNQFVWTNSAGFVAAADDAGLDSAEFGTVSVTVYVLVALLSAYALTVIGSATVERSRGTFAQWRLMGASPRQVRRGLWSLAGIASVAGALPGSLASIGASALAVPLFDRMAAQSFPKGTGDFAPPAFQPSVAAWAGAFLVGVVTCMLGAFGPAWRAARVEPVEAVRGAATPRRRGAWVRWAVGGLLLFVALTAAVGGVAAPRASDVGTDAGVMVNSAIMAGLIAALGVYALGAGMLPPLLAVARGALRALPAPVGGVAARSARASGDLNANLIAPLAAAIGLGAVMFTAIRSYLDTLRIGGFPVSNPNYSDVLVMTGLFGVFALFTSIAVVALGGRDAVREQAVLRASGMTPRQVTALAGWNSLLLTGCATVFALIPIGFAGVVVAARSALVVGTPVLDVPWLGLVAAALACWAVLFLVQWARIAPWLGRDAADALRAP